MDYDERATWRAFKQAFPNVKRLRYAFHWTKSIFENLKKIGLVPHYCNRTACA